MRTLQISGSGVLLLLVGCGTVPALFVGWSANPLDSEANGAPRIDVTEPDSNPGTEPDRPIIFEVGIQPDTTDVSEPDTPSDAPESDTPPIPDVSEPDAAPTHDATEDTPPSGTDLPDTGAGSFGTCCDETCETRCDLGTQECCIDIGDAGAECVTTGVCESEVVATCDGAEDYVNGGLCCIQGTFRFDPSETELSATCVDSCDYVVDIFGESVRTVACHGTADCGDGQSCCSESRLPTSLCLDGRAAGGIEIAGGVCDRE